MTLAPALWDDHEAALDVACPLDGCHAKPGEPCRNLATGDPLTHLPAHAARLRAAGVRHAPIDRRELADPDSRRGRW